MPFINNINHYVYNEVLKLKQNPLPFVLGIVMPFAAWIVIALAYQNGNVDNIALTIVDYDNSSLTRQITRQMESAEALKVILVTQDKQKADELLQSNHSFATVTFEKNFTKKINQGKGAAVNITLNSFSMIYSKVIYKEAAKILLANSTQIQARRLVAAGFSRRQSSITAAPVSLSVQSEGNPYLNYTLYMLPGLLFSLLQMSGSFSALWLFRENIEQEDGRSDLPPKRWCSFVVGRLISLLVMNFITVFVLFAIIFPWINLPVNSQYFSLFLLTLLLMIVSIGMGALVSVAFKNITTGAQLLLGINAPAFVFAGYTFPRWAMPWAAQKFAGLMPITHFLDAFFPMFLYNETPKSGVIPLLISGIIVWGIVLVIIVIKIKRKKDDIQTV